LLSLIWDKSFTAQAEPDNDMHWSGLHWPRVIVETRPDLTDKELGDSADSPYRVGIASAKVSVLWTGRPA
jgi:hypothetical protein